MTQQDKPLPYRGYKKRQRKRWSSTKKKMGKAFTNQYMRNKKGGTPHVVAASTQAEWLCMKCSSIILHDINLDDKKWHYKKVEFGENVNEIAKTLRKKGKTISSIDLKHNTKGEVLTIVTPLDSFQKAIGLHEKNGVHIIYPDEWKPYDDAMVLLLLSVMYSEQTKSKIWNADDTVAECRKLKTNIFHNKQGKAYFGCIGEYYSWGMKGSYQKIDEDNHISLAHYTFSKLFLLR